MYIICSGSSLHSITEDQYMLASRGGISIAESNELADFEREAYVNLVIKDARVKLQNMENRK